jgi:hypothetical protein
MSDHKICPGCNTTNNSESELCVSCGYPFDASEINQSKFIGQLILKKSAITDAKTKLKHARLALWAIGAYFILSTLYIFTVISFDLLPFTYYLPGIFFGLIFVSFGFLSYRLPLISIIIPLVLLIAYWVFSAVIDTNSLLSGFFFKIAILMVLGYALLSAFKAQKLKKESHFLENQ